jgi:hypothetical protein
MLGRQKSCGVGCARIRLRILGSIHVAFAGRELDATQSFVWSVIGGFTRGVMGNGVSGRLKSNDDFHCRRC